LTVEYESSYSLSVISQSSVFFFDFVLASGGV
jgi:hypothetical protein